MKHNLYFLIFVLGIASCNSSRSLPHYETWTIKRIYPNGMIKVKHIMGAFQVERPDTLKVGDKLKVAVNFKDTLKGNVKIFSTTASLG